MMKEMIMWPLVGSQQYAINIGILAQTKSSIQKLVP